MAERTGEPAAALVWGVRALGLADAVVSSARRLRGSMSEAGVYWLTAPSGPAVMKAVLPASGEQQLRAARREIESYERVLPRTSLRAPTLLARHSSHDGVAVLLTAHRDRAPDAPWDDDDWTQLAHDLAALHAAPAPAPGSSALGPAYASVLDGLHAPAHATVTGFWSRPGEPALLGEVLAAARDLEAAVRAAGSALVHGDCHLGNAVREQGHLVWLDWQETGTASPALDLGFAIARAVPDGHPPSLDAVLDAYLRTSGRPPDARVLRRAVVAAQLAVLVTSWPHFAGYNTPEAVDRVHRHVRELLDEWRRGW